MTRDMRFLFVVPLLAAAASAQEPEPPKRPDPAPDWRLDELERDVQGELEIAWRKELGSTSFGGACAADVDGDGDLEVAFGTYFGDSKAWLLNGEDGSEVWVRDFGGGAGGACLDASFRFADLDGNGLLELLVPVSSGCVLHALDARTGERRWSYGTGAGDCIDSPAAVLDLDGDGDIEIVFGSFKHRLHVVRGRDGKLVKHVRVGKGFVQTCPVVIDVNGDGVRDFVAGTFKGDNRLYARSGVDDAELWHVQVGEGDPGDIGIYHGPAVGDLDGDDVPEIVLTAYDGVVRCIESATGAERWRVVPGDRYFMAPPAIGDVDGDGKPEVVAVSQRVTVISADGEVRYSAPISPRLAWLAADRGPSLADLDGDGRLDIALLRADGWFAVLRGSTGELLWEFEGGKLDKLPAISNAHGPLLADLTGDGLLDAFFVVGCPAERARWGVAVCLTGFVGMGEGWTMLRHDLRNTGNAATPVAKPEERR